MAKPTTSYSSVAKNNTSFTGVSKPTTSYGNNSSYVNGIQLDSSVVTLDSLSVYLNGFTTSSVGNQLNDKSITSFSGVTKPTTDYLAGSKPTTNYGEV